MNQIFCQESPDDLFKICRQQLEKNSNYLSVFIKLGNQLIKSISQLMFDYKTLDQHFRDKLDKFYKEYNNRKYEPQICQNIIINLRQASIDYQISEISILDQMDNLQKEFRNLIQKIDDNHFKSDSQAQILYFDAYGEVKKSIKFKQYQECNYFEISNATDHQSMVVAAEISPDQTQLVSISYQTMYIWNLSEGKLIKKYDIKDFIISFTFIYPTNNIIFGDFNGMIYQILSKDDKSEIDGFQVHSDEIYFILIKNLNEIFTCSKDNTIKLINIEQRQVLQTIDYICSCRCNFIYIEVENILIVPNGQNLSIFDGQDGLQLYRTHYGQAEMFLQILLSNNYENLYLNQPSKYEIKIYFVDCQAKQIRLTQIIKLTSYCYNISLCFGDDILVILDEAGFQLRHLINDLPLIKEIQSYGNSMFFFNRQHPKLSMLFNPQNFNITLYERRS